MAAAVLGLNGTVDWLFLLPLFLLLTTLPGDATGLAPGRRPAHRHRTPVCPPETELLPCACLLRGDGIHIMCENSEREVVMSSMEVLMKRVLRVEELHLVGNRIPVLPGRIFGSIQINKLFLINNEMVGINRNAFAGLESTLEHLYISEPGLYDLPFDTLDNLANLRTCVIENTDISEIPRMYSLSKLEFLKIDGSRVANIPSAAFRFMPNMKKVHIANSQLKKIDSNALEGLVYLKEVNFSNNVIDWIHPRAFRTLNTVEHLSLAGNRLTRAAMAVLATRELKALRILDLSRNLMTEFSKGTFVDMPTVQMINVQDNSISKIEHGAFFRLPSLRRIDLSGNLLDEFHVDIFTESPSIEHLKIARNNLTVMADMRYVTRALPNLISLDVSQNHLQIENTRIFQGHNKLEALRLDHNEIEHLNKDLFNELPNLRELYLSNNFIQSDLPGQVWDLPELRVLDLSYNDMKKVDAQLLEGVPLVSSLDLSFNVITDVAENAFSDAIHVKSLNMSFNSIAKLPRDVFGSLTELFELEMSFNELLALDGGLLEGLTSLEFLHLTHNQIVTIDAATFQNISKLRYLDLSANLIQDIPTEALGKLTSLEVLKLHRNAINQLHDDFFLGLTTVEHLDLSNNHIQALGQTAFRDLSALVDLDLSVNYIQSLHPDMFSSTKQLEKLNISHNYVADLGHHTFDNVKPLRILDLTNNSLTELGEVVKGLSSLQGLFISDNYITELKNTSFLDLPSLNILRFEHNGLQTFEPGTFHNMNSLIILDLQDNNLVELNPDSFKSLRSLEELKISRNQISIVKDFAFTDLPSLRSLELQDNVITEMGAHAFQGMPSIKFLNLSRNGFQDIPEDALARLDSLDVLDLSWNYILEVKDSSFRQLEWLTVLMLHDNDLCHLSEESFSMQRALRVLTLHNNQLKRLHLHALGTTINGLSLLDMSGNPFRCDCELVWLREYLLEDPLDGRGPRTTILGHAMRGVPVCAAPSQYQGLPITQVPATAFLCEGPHDPRPQQEACVPRFLDPLLLTSSQAGEHLNPGAVNTLLQLANLSETLPEAVTGVSYLDYNNPILVHDLPGLVSTTSSSSSSTSTPATSAAVSASRPAVALSTLQQTASQQEVVESSALHTITGDTPTIYAGSSSDDPRTTTTTTSSPGLFGGLSLPTLPNLLASLTNLKLPHVGLNVGWGGFPSLGRQESAVHSKLGPLEEEDKPMKGPDYRQPIWIEGPAGPHPMFPPPPPDGNSTAPPPPSPASSDEEPGAGGQPRPVTGQEEGRAKASGRPLVPLRGPGLPFRFPEGQGERLRPGVPGLVVPVSRPGNVWGERPPPHPVLPPMAHPGPGPNSGTPFFPGLSAHQPGHANHGRPAIIPTHHHPSPPPLTPTSPPQGHAPPVTVPPGAVDPKGGSQGEPQWSPPEVIHPDSGVSHYQPGEPFLPFTPHDHNHPITVIQAPHISVAHHGTRSSPPLPTPTTPDMSPSETHLLDDNNVVPRTTNDTSPSDHSTSSPAAQPPQHPASWPSSSSRPPVLDTESSSQSRPHLEVGSSTEYAAPHHSPAPPRPPPPSSLEPSPTIPNHQQKTSSTHLQPSSSHTQTTSTETSPVTSHTHTSQGVSPQTSHTHTSQISPQTSHTHMTSPEVIATSPHTPASQLDDSQGEEEEDQPKHSLSDLLHLLYAAEEEVQRETQEDRPSDTGSPPPQTERPSARDGPQTDNDVADQWHKPSSVTALTVATVSTTPEPPPPSLSTTPSQPSTTPSQPSTTTSQPSTTTTTSQQSYSTSTSQPSSSTGTSRQESNRSNLPAGVFPPLLGEGVRVLKDQPSAPADPRPHWHHPSLSRHPMQERPPSSVTPTAAHPSTPPRGHPHLTGTSIPPRDRPDPTGAPAPIKGRPDPTGTSTPTRGRPDPTGAPAPTRGRPDPSGAPAPTRGRPGVVLPVAKSGEPLGRRPSTNNTYISPSRSVGRGGFPTIERVYQGGQRSPDAHTVAVQGVDLPQDAQNAHTVAVQGVDLPQDAQNDGQAVRETEFETSQVNAVDWYYNNYFREYSSLPVGGNTPPSAAPAHRSSCAALFIYLAIIIHNHVLW